MEKSVEFHCPICSKTFPRSFNLRRHCVSVHQCPMAGPLTDVMYSPTASSSNVEPYEPQPVLQSTSLKMSCNATSLSTKTSWKETEASVFPKKHSSEIRDSTGVAATTSTDAIPTHPSSKMASSVTQYLLGEIPAEQYVSIQVAASDVLERHHQYNIPELCRHVRENYPEIPSDVVPYVIMSLIEGAKHVGLTFNTYRAYRKRPQARYKESVRNVRQSMAAWAYGARPTHKSRNRFPENPVPSYNPTKLHLLKKSGDESSSSQSGSEDSESDSYSSVVKYPLVRPRTDAEELEVTELHDMEPTDDEDHTERSNLKGLQPITKKLQIKITRIDDEMV
jgi:hypothetical protein